MASDIDVLILEVDSAGSDCDLAVGMRLGDYETVEQIGAGATSKVFRARHIKDGGEVAIKMLELTPSTKHAHLQRLAREMTVSQRVAHPNVVCIYEVRVVPAKCAYLVMELVRGKTLADILQEEGPLSVKRAANILHQTSIGLAAAHDLGFIHRDLKPSNLMVFDDGGVERVKILDFGIVASTKEPPPDEPLTEEHSILGTPMYMAPEQLESSTVGPAADIYALGGILYHMLAGRQPFSGTFREILAQQMLASPDPLPDFAGLGPICMQMLKKSPAARPASARDIAGLSALILADLRPQVVPYPSDQCAPGQCPTGQDAAEVEVNQDTVATEIGPTVAELTRAETDEMMALERAAGIRTNPRFVPHLAPVKNAVSKVVNWPLRISIPLVTAVAFAGGACAARELLEPPRAPAESYQITTMEPTGTASKIAEISRR